MHVKDHVVYVRVQRITETPEITQHALDTSGSVRILKLGSIQKYV